MNKLVLSTLALAAILGSCSKDDDCRCVDTNDLITPELAEMSVTTGDVTTAFTGVLMVYPCQEDASIYYGNYSLKGDPVAYQRHLHHQRRVYL